MSQVPKLYEATEHIPSIGARKGDFVMEYPDHLTVVRDRPLALLTDDDRSRMAPVIPRLRRSA